MEVPAPDTLAYVVGDRALFRILAAERGRRQLRLADEPFPGSEQFGAPLSFRVACRQEDDLQARAGAVALGAEPVGQYAGEAVRHLAYRRRRGRLFGDGRRAGDRFADGAATRYGVESGRLRKAEWDGE
ncbi:hypothetical protein [Streptomyces sp. NPDC006307]|uniref:hypothetical protein n=1 Tax=Streptomyces sp. NPDC006307 TaxID=3156748 RepID=UPI0033A7DF1D